MNIKSKTVPLTANNLTKGVKNYIKVLGGWAVRVNVTGVYDTKQQLFRRVAEEDKGVSDVVACYKGRAVFVEIKIGNDTESMYQKRFKKEMTRAGAVCIVAKNMEQFINEFNSHFDEKSIKQQ